MKKHNTLIAAFAILGITCATAQAGHHHGPPHRDLYTVLDIISVVSDVCRTAAIINPRPVEIRTTSTYVQPTASYVQPTATYVQPSTVVQPTTTYVQPSTVVQPMTTYVQPSTVVQPVVTAPTVVQPVITTPTVIYGSGYYYPSSRWYYGSHYHHRPAPPPPVHRGFRPAPMPHHPGVHHGPGLGPRH